MRKLISNYTNYEIDENGCVYNINTKKQLKGSIGEGGYKYYRLSKNGQKKMYYAHRLVAETFIDNPNNLPMVNHIDGNKLNNNINNLEWVSQSDNIKKAYKIGLISSHSEADYYIDDLENEQWKQIYDLPYSISSLGRVKNERTQLLLKPSLSSGYYKVRPSVAGKPQDLMIHKIVYCIFNNINQIPKGYVVDHINGNKLDNRLDNLRLITLSENVLAALYETNTNNTNKIVLQYDLHNNLLNTFRSTRDAAKQLNLDSSTISKVCRGINKTHGGFKFKYKD